MPKKLRKMVLLAAVLGLFVHTQAVFACEMMDLSGPVEHCCCEGVAEDMAQGVDGLDACCEVSQELVLTSTDPDAAEPFILTVKSSTDPPVALFVAIPLLFDQTLDSTVGRSRAFPRVDPAHPGTRTYLATLRLRI